LYARCSGWERESSKLFPDWPLTRSVMLLQPANVKRSLVDEIGYLEKTGYRASSTPASVRGFFYREDAPVRQKGETIIDNAAPNGRVCKAHGCVLDSVTGRPIPGAVINTWEASTNGKYDVWDKDQQDGNLRGRFTTDANGEYAFYCLKPTPYSLPPDCKYRLKRGCGPSIVQTLT
jgi:protocatechuate 3,4-dioxygenase beta subunit